MTTMTPQTALDYALAYTTANIKVIPIRPGAKHPPIPKWQQAATTDTDQINTWWTDMPDHGIGLALGPQPNGRNLFAIDVDQHGHDGHSALRALVKQNGPLPITWTQNTGGGGLHIILAAPDDVPIRNQQAEGNRLGPGLDIRGAGGQIVAAPSIHPKTGARYEWQSGRAPWDIPVADAPTWLIDLLTADLSIKNSPETIDNPSIKNSPETIDNLSIKNSPETIDNPSIKNSPETIDSHSIKNSPETIDSHSIKNSPETIDSHSIKNSPETIDNEAMWRQFRNDWNWHNQLERTGWTIVRDNNQQTLWARPGKNPRDGHSAVLHEPDGPFVIFTTETPANWTAAATPTADRSGWTLSAFGLYSAIYHQGDRSAAARELDRVYNQHAANLHDLLPAPTDFDNVQPGDNPYDTQLLGQLVNWQDFWNADHDTENWLVEPILAEARAHAIYAPGGTGKSLLALTIALNACRNGHNVLYLDYEMTAADLADRLSEMGIDETNEETTRLHYALLPTIPACDTPEGGIAVNRLAELVDANLVVIDTFSRAVAGDENEADTIRAFYRLTAQKLKASGRASVRLDHQGKDPDKGQRGSSAKNDDVDIVWALRRNDDGITLVAKKRRMGWVPETVTLVERRDPLRFEHEQRDLDPPGTMQAVIWLDAAGIDPKLGLNATWKAIKNMPNRPARNAAFAAQRKRAERDTVDGLISKTDSGLFD